MLYYGLQFLPLKYQMNIFCCCKVVEGESGGGGGGFFTVRSRTEKKLKITKLGRKDSVFPNKRLKKFLIQIG